KQRESETFDGRHTQYGHDVAYALPVRIRELEADKLRFHRYIKEKAAEIDAMTADIARLSGGRESLEKLAPLAEDPNRLKDVITPFGKQLEEIGNRAKAAGGSASTDANGKPVISDTQRLA